MKHLIIILSFITLSLQAQKAHVTEYNTALAANESYLSQGIRWFQYGHASQGGYVRLGSVSGYPLNASPGNAALPIQGAMRGCVLNDAGKVVYYLNPTNWAYKASVGNAGTVASDLTGTDGQVMVEIPKFYYKYVGANNSHEWRISLHKLTGYEVHPAFIKDNVEVNYRYIGAYEGILYDNSGAAYLDGTAAGRGTPDFTAATGDKLSSVSGKIPYSNATRANFRQAAKNRGSSWRQLDYDLVHAIELLMLIEYGTFYTQSIADIGPGITAVTDWASISYYPFVISGNGNIIGNASGDNAGATAYATEATKYSKYRGIENFYGHVWKFVDGINVNSNVPYITNNSAIWTDDTSTGYTNPNSITLVNADGWQRGLAYSSRMFLPSIVGGSDNTYLTDYYYQAAGWRVALFGGAADDGSATGAWCWALALDSGVMIPRIGSRLAY